MDRAKSGTDATRPPTKVQRVEPDNKENKSSLMNRQANEISSSYRFAPIKALHPYSRDFRLQVRITSKSMGRAKNGGKILRIVMTDLFSAQIGATFFYQDAEKYDALFEESKVYEVSNAYVVEADARYYKLPNNYCLKFHGSSRVEASADDG